MHQITIRNLDDAVVQRLKQLAWEDGLPLEETLRRLLADASNRNRRDHLARHFPEATD